MGRVPADMTAVAAQLVRTRRDTDWDGRLPVRRGELERVRRGAYAPVVADDAAGRRLRALRHIAAVVAQSSGRICISHQSSALVWDLPVLRLPQQTHVTQPSTPSSRGDGSVRRHCGRLDEDERTERAAVPVTTICRTVLDCARTMPTPDALVIADGALRAGVDLTPLDGRLLALAGRNGAARARRVLDLARPGSESAPESLVRWLLIRAGLPEPELQVVVATPFGTFRADMGWRRAGLLLEFDGRQKYGELAGGDPAGVLFREKERQHAIEAEGWRVLRITWRDVKDVDRLVGMVGRALAAGGQRG